MRCENCAIDNNDTDLKKYNTGDTLGFYCRCGYLQYWVFDPKKRFYTSKLDAVYNTYKMNVKLWLPR